MSGQLIIGIIASLLGMVYMAYGKRQVRYAALLSGLGLCVYPYFVDNWIWSCVVGVVLLAVPFFIEG